jgi:methionyl aminopeptidase
MTRGRVCLPVLQGAAAMRAASQLAARALQLAGSLVQPGVTTEQLDAAVHDFIIAHGAYPSPLGYHGFPKSICTSVNEVVCHGIPDSRCAGPSREAAGR